MVINILAVGDVSGTCGIEILSDKLRSVIKWGGIGFTVVNGENASGLGLTPAQAEAMLEAGADVVTLGNHTWANQRINKFLDDNRYILRPSNFAPQVPGRGSGVFETSAGSICVINLIGRVGLHDNNENPFFEVDRILKNNAAKIILIDFHAEATSEKQAMAYYLDGRVSALWGTHTHVQTSDCRVMPGGTGYITDLGMTGAIESVIGMKPDQPISRFLGNPPQKFEPADGPAKIEGAIFVIDAETGKCLSVEAVRIS